MATVSVSNCQKILFQADKLRPLWLTVGFNCLEIQYDAVSHNLYLHTSYSQKSHVFSFVEFKETKNPLKGKFGFFKPGPTRETEDN